MGVLYNLKNECCGCSACMNACPEQAIAMIHDDEGFLFPEIDHNRCVDCGLCKETCAFQDKEKPLGYPISTYAAINRNEEALKKSSSGGVFTALANITFKKEGIICGSAFNNYLTAEHVCTDSIRIAEKMMGSKYVQSDTGNTFKEVWKNLQNGRQVLYTGTPCQIDGLKRYLMHDYDTLLTADLICHGVSSPLLFGSYISFLTKAINGTIVDFRFRDKTKSGMAVIGRVKYKKNNSFHEKTIHPLLHAYYYYYLKGAIFRSSCYNCKYASAYRPGDFTIGDYWGVEKAHPEINTEKGVSVMIVNSKKGMKLIEDLNKELDLTESTYDKASANNGNLLHPTSYNVEREVIFEIFKAHGYKAVDEYFRKSLGIKLLGYKTKAMFPISLKNRIKQYL